MTTADKLTYIKSHHAMMLSCDACNLTLGQTCPRKNWGDWTPEEVEIAYDILTSKPEFTKVTHEEAEAEARYDTHKKICDQLYNIYRTKNADYGNTFSKGFTEYGMMMPLIRIEDKFSRFKRLAVGGKQNVKDESIKDTLIDLANYAIMTLIEMEANNG